MQYIYKTKAEFDAAKFNPNDPIFKKQEEYLATLKREDFKEMFAYYDEFRKENLQGYELIKSENYRKFSRALVELKLIFSFDWMSWNTGATNINNKTYDYKLSSLLELSMYLTSIFRAEKFNPGTIAVLVSDGTLDKIFLELRLKSFINLQ